MSPKEIIILLKLLDVTQSSVAKNLNITVPAVNSVIKGLRQNPRIRQAIAAAIGRPVEQIWPPENAKKETDKRINQHIKNSEPVQAENQ
jgi:lambda repressor-like predicted transcriptional regulator